MIPGNILITGGAGFVGRALVGQCLRNGHKVFVIDNLCAGKLSNLHEFQNEITFFETDILDSARLRAALEEAQPEIIFHLAAHHFIPFCNAHPQETIRVNVDGSFALLSEAARLGARIAVLASSGALYPSQDCPLDEDLAVSPVDVYGLSKQLMEQIGQFISRTLEMSCIAARLFNVYGPFETNPHLIPEIIESLKLGSTVYLGNIHTKRDYIYVDDVAESLYRCATIPQSGYTVVNVGTGIEYSAEEIVDTLAQLLGSEIEIRIDPSRRRSVDKLFQRACTLRFERLTGTRSRISLHEGLRLLLEHEGWRLGRTAAEPTAYWPRQRHA